MDGEPDDARIVGELRAVLARAAARLAEAGARDEALAEYVPPRRVMLFTRDAVMVPEGRVWRLGVLLLTSDARVFATGSITRALEPGRPAYQSQSAETRRDYRAAAFRGRFARGETVNFDATPIELDAQTLRSSTGPLFIDGDQALVRWNIASGDPSAMPLETYLADRVALLADPPAGA